MTGHSSSSDDSSPSGSSRSSSPTIVVPKAYARLENDSEQVQTLVEREKEKMYRKRPYSVSLSSGSELDSSPESNVPKAYSRKETKKIMHEDGNSWKKRTRVPSSSSSSSDSSSSSLSGSDSSSDSETEHFSQNQQKKNLSLKDRTKDNTSSRQHRSNNQSENLSRKEHEGEKKLHQRRDRSHLMVAQSPEEIRQKKREVEDKPRSSKHTDVVRSYSQERNYRDSMFRGRNEDKTHRHHIDHELRRDQEPIHVRDESSKKNNHKEKDVKRDGSQSEKDRRYYDRLKEALRGEGSNSRRREEERYRDGDTQKMVHKSSRTVHAVEHSQSRAKSSRERDRRKIDEISKQGLDHERFSVTEVHSRSKSKSSKEREHQRVKHESSVSSGGREYFSTERGCWEWEPLEEPSRKAPDELGDQASYRHDRRQNSREGRTDSTSRHSVKESSHAKKHHKRESLDVDSKRTAHSSVSPVKTKSDSLERRKRKMERAKEKERAKLKKEKHKRREKLERRKAKKKERREHHSKKSKEKRHKERKERRSKEPKGPKISSIQAKLLNLAAGVQEPAPRILAPMTKEEYDRKQSRTRRVYDEDTGRHRLVRGEGEIIEEIVSRDRHRQINKQATRGDGISYQRSLGLHRY